LHEMLLADKKLEPKETNELGVGPPEEEGKSDGSLPTPFSLPQKDNMQKVPDNEEEFIVPVRDDGAQGEQDNAEGKAEEKLIEGDREGGKDTGNRVENSELERKRLEEEKKRKQHDKEEEEKEERRREDRERREQKSSAKGRISGEGRVGKTGEGVVATYSKPSSTSGLYTMSVIFYMGLFAVIAGGGWLCRSKRGTSWAASVNGSATTTSKIATTIWKEREDSMMKLL